jgi:hypothetical protein
LRGTRLAARTQTNRCGDGNILISEPSILEHH